MTDHFQPFRGGTASSNITIITGAVIPIADTKNVIPEIL